MKWFRKLAPFLVQLIICGLFLELFSYFFLKHSSNPLYRARRIIKFDSHIGWMQKPNLETTFEGKDVVTDKNGFRHNDSSPEVITLGPSSAFGWGVEADETYSSLTAKSYINASGIGHSIFQGKMMWEELKGNKPRFVIIAYGVNDLDKFRFFDADATEDRIYFSNNHESGFLNSSSSNFATVLSLAMNLAAYQMDCKSLLSPSIRVPWNQYSSILDEMIQDMKAKNIIPILINTPFYLEKPRQDFKVEMIENAYAKASSLAKNQQCKEAHEALKEAKLFEPDNILYQVKSFNEKLKQFADEKGIKLIDAYGILSSETPSKMFVDPVHPSPLGHKKISSQILKAMLN